MADIVIDLDAELTGVNVQQRDGRTRHREEERSLFVTTDVLFIEERLDERRLELGKSLGVQDTPVFFQDLHDGLVVIDEAVEPELRQTHALADHVQQFTLQETIDTPHQSRRLFGVVLLGESCQHLRHKIFIYISEICTELVAEQFLVNHVLREIFIPKRQGYKQPGIRAENFVF